MTMKRIILSAVLAFALACVGAQTPIPNRDSAFVRNVILINTSPWYVVMNRQGDIFSKISHRPDYLSNYEEKGVNPQYQEEQSYVSDSKYDLRTDNTSKLEPNSLEGFREDAAILISERELEVNFKKGTATIIDGEISRLDRIVKYLQDNPDKKFKLFSFTNEPINNSYILSTRRVNAVLKYLGIKGINVDERLVFRNTVRGRSNKITFFLID